MREKDQSMEWEYNVLLKVLLFAILLLSGWCAKTDILIHDISRKHSASSSILRLTEVPKGPL